MKTEAGNRLGTEKIGKLMLELALPSVLAQIVNVLYNVVDRIYIGHIPEVGKLALTGVGVCMPLIMLISAFAMLAGMGGAPRASIMLGRNDAEEAERILGNCAALLILVAVTLTVLFQLFAKPFLLTFGASRNTIGFAMDYIRIYACGTIFVQLTLGLNAFITAQGFAKISMKTTLIGAVTNIILDPIFIFVLGMGVKGAALATVLSQALSATWVLTFLLGKQTTLKLRLKNFRLQGRVILPCVLLGLSPFVMQSTESILNICFNSSLLKYGGDTAVGAMTILTSVMQFSMLPLQGLSQGAQPIISFNYGAKNIDRVKKAFHLLLRSAACYSTLLWLLCMLVPQIFISIFTSDADLASYTIWALRIYMAASLLFAVQLACQQTFIALGNAKTSVFLALLRKVLLLIPLIFILPHFVSNPAFGVFVAEPVADTIAVATTAALFFREYKKLG